MEENLSGFWSSETLHTRLPELIKEFRPSRIKHCAYELALGGEAFVTGEKERQIMDESGEVVIPEGQFALLITEEVITIPPDAIAFISMKSAFKFRGLINVSGFHVDPGFSGKLIFSVFNAGVQQLHISCGAPLFLIWFASLDTPTSNVYQGPHKGQMRIPDGVVTNIAAKHPSPTALQKDLDDAKQALQKELNDVRKDVAHWRSITWLLLGLAAAGTIGSLLTNIFKTTPPALAPVQVIMPGVLTSPSPPGAVPTVGNAQVLPAISSREPPGATLIPSATASAHGSP